MVSLVTTATIELRMLGPLEARIDGAPVPLGGGKQRALVAILLLHANDVVPLDVLIDELWDGTPPPSAPAYVQNCVSRLRKVLGADALETRAPGYRLRVAPDQIDARHFEQLVREARAMPARERATALREALALWHGTPLSDFAYRSFAQDAIRNLEEQRVNALQMRLEAELELGHHRDAIGELDALVREHPTHERLRWLQMLALHRSDRRQDALAAYQEARLAIVEESGMEPGEELRALQRRILQDDPTLMPGATADEAVERPEHLARKVVAVCIVELLVDDELDVEAARGVVSRGLASLEEIVLRYGGTVEQLLGEEAVAVFGLPAAHEDDVLRALRSVVELRDAMTRLPIRAAVETGEVLVGGNGRGLSGGPLTTARRVKETAGAGEILLGRAAAAQSAGAAWTEPSEGGHRLVELVEGAPAIARRPDAPLVGRRAELDRLVVAVRETAASSSCRRVVALGEPGIGKTRLAAELVRTLGDETRVFTGRCVPYAEGATYLPLAEIVEQIAGNEERGPEIERILAGEPDGERAASRLEEALSGLGAVDSGDVFWATRKLLETLARQRQLLVVLEDVHWAEPTFLDLLEYLVGWSTGAPIALVCLARPELLDSRPAWAADTLALRPLADDETAQLLDTLPEALALDADARAAVVSTAEGNPLFLEQLAAHALDDPAETAKVPASLESLLASRLDSLPPPERSVLERAAIVGREFTRAAVDALAVDDAPGSAAGLLALVRRRLARPDTGPTVDDAFRFDHALIWEAAYSAIARTERARLHERLARWFDQRSATDELVGHHLEQAVLNRRATGQDTDDLALEAGRRLAVAGERAAWSMDQPAAIRLLRRAAELLPDADAGRFRAHCVLGFALKSTGAWQEAIGLLRDTAERARAADDRKHELWAALEQLWPQTLEGTALPHEMWSVLADADQMARDERDDLLLARARDAMSTLESRDGRFDDGYSSLQLAADAYARCGLGGFRDPTLVGYALEGRQPLAEVIARCEACLAADAPRWRHGYILVVLADAEACRGSFGRANQLIARARASFRESGQVFGEETVWAFAAGYVAVMEHDGTKASRVLLPALAKAEERDDGVWQVQLGTMCAEAALLEGDVEGALRLAEQARSVAPNMADLHMSYAIRSALARALQAKGEVDRAEEELRTEIARWDASDALMTKARLRLVLAEVLAANERHVEAEKAAVESLRLFDQKGATHLVGVVRTFIEEMAEGGARR